ncbi:High frequency lysogenization protein hflD [Enterobacter cancerogenus]|uniref:High frequency lysogenization protein hflD n=1 Tax=Enterobacter cancerogenus TaxID=69218 RepID=A0A484X8E3_9ENTR|nr:High frequency lysogenization protein hflD [Enterobacter cancerogenus]
MAKNYYDITLALAGICQSARLVQQLAHQGHCDADALHVSLNSVIDLNPGSTLGFSAAVRQTFASVLKPYSACSTPAVARV